MSLTEKETAISNTESNIIIDEKYVDSTLSFMKEHDSTTPELTSEETKSLNFKLLFILFPLILTINTILFIDKATLSYSSILGLFEHTHIDTLQYDNLNSIFYAGYTIGQILNFVLQRFNFAKIMNLIIFIWGVIVIAHCGAENYAGLIVLRFLLGFTESVITPGLEITLLQFFTPKQRATLQPVFWVSCVGTSVIIAAFIAYGVLHLPTNISLEPWQLFMIITAAMTFATAIWSIFIYPSNPAKLKFLTIKERVNLIRLIESSTSSSIEQPHVKKQQIIECLKDPISWLFTLLSFCLMLSNNLAYQQNLLYLDLGVTNLGATLVNVAGGVFSSLFHLAGAVLIHYFPNNTRWIILMATVPSIAGGIGMITITWSNKIALLAMLVMASNTFGLLYIVVLGWCTQSCSGHTKRFFRNAMFMFGYGISNIVSPQLWKGNQGSHNGIPRYYAAWIVQILVAWVGTPVLGFVIHFILTKRNKERLSLNFENIGHVAKIDQDGEEILEDVDVGYLDLTDYENKKFIYPL